MGRASVFATRCYYVPRPLLHALATGMNKLEMVPDNVCRQKNKRLPVPVPLPSSSLARQEAATGLCLGVHPGVTSAFSESLTSALSYIISIPLS